jgi:hypothetical protein
MQRCKRRVLANVNRATGVPYKSYIDVTLPLRRSPKWAEYGGVNGHSSTAEANVHNTDTVTVYAASLFKPPILR